MSALRPAEAVPEAELAPGVREERAVLEAIYGAEFEVLGPAEWRRGPVLTGPWPSRQGELLPNFSLETLASGWLSFL